MILIYIYEQRVAQANVLVARVKMVATQCNNVWN